jgi:ubiquinol-cytochrome c reductase subunit 8
MSSNRLNPLAGTLNAAIFNTFRRTRGQIFYWAPPLILGYYTMQWAIERYAYHGHKEGILGC